MARVTVEDCAEVVPSRFELVALAAQRAKLISAGGEIAVDRDNDKDAVVSLREIAERKVDVDYLRELLVQNCQEKVKLDEYGVEEAKDAGEDISEAAEDLMKEMQGSAAQVELDDSLYGEENMDYED
jgi:DNA-directed RNA polymerase subunit omega